MRENDDWRAARPALQILLEPGKLGVTEKAEAAALEVDHIGQADEMHTAFIEAIPVARAPAAILARKARKERVAVIDQHVVFARYVMHRHACIADDLRGRV